MHSLPYSLVTYFIVIMIISTPSPKADMEGALPSASPAASLKGSPVVEELRKLCNQCDGIKAEREAIEAEIKDASFDMGL